jgi:hypothetical protein
MTCSATSGRAGPTRVGRRIARSEDVRGSSEPLLSAHDVAGGLIARIRGLGPDRLDVLLAVVLFAGSAAELSVQLAHSPRRAVTLATLLAICGGLARRR